MPENENERNDAQNIIHHIANGEPTKAGAVIGTVLGKSAMAGIEATKVETGANMFMGKSDGDEE